MNLQRGNFKLYFWNIYMLFSKLNILIIVILSNLLVASILITQDSITYNDLNILLFYGHGVGYFNLMDFLILLVYNGIPLYILSFFLEQDNIDRGFHLTIRIKQKRIWYLSIFGSAVIFIFTYVVVSLIICFIVSCLFGLPLSGYDYGNDLFNYTGVEKINLINLLLIIMTSKILELLLCFLIIFIFFCYTKTAAVGYILLQIIYIICLFDLDFIGYIPIGMSSLGRMSEFVGLSGLSYISSISILSFWVCLLVLISIRSYKRIFN